MNKIFDMKKVLKIIILTLSSFSVHAQQDNQTCVAEVPSQHWENHFQQLISEFKSNEKHKNSSSFYTIPVIFHIIHGGETVGTYPNLTQGQINSQLVVLNQDFSGTAYNIANYPVNAFVNWAINQALPTANLDINGRVKIADFNIQFCLATKDPLGNILPEPGIDRINYVSNGLQNPNAFATQATFKTYLDNTLKPNTIWDVTKYMNVWITDKNTALTSGGVSSVPPLSGLSGIPNTATDSTDGIWCYAKATGSYMNFPTGHYVSTNVDGRTLTHETGHYLGLRHIWGDASCATDYCNDTPPSESENGGSPTYPHNVGSCSSPSNNPDGEMFMNYMDYTMGPSKYMFTVDQMTRAQTAMLNSPFRNQLGTHGLCSTTSLGTNTFDYTNTVTISPNPTNSNVNINFTNQILLKVNIYALTGELLQEHLTSKFSIENLPKGIYFIITQTNKSTYINKLIKQ